MHDHAWGVGLRPHHFSQWLQRDEVPLLEILSDNFLFQKGGPGLWHLAKLRERTSCVLHGVGLNIGGIHPLDESYVQALKQLVDVTKPHLVSDHLCFTKGLSGSSFDLLPFAYTSFNLTRVGERVKRVQEILGRELVLENVSSYVSYQVSEMTEFEFLNELALRTGCRVLLDVNNLFVSGFNHGISPHDELKRLMPQHVAQYHIAGHSESEGYLHDTHDEPVKNEVWGLLAQALATFGPRPLILERDDDDSSLPVLMEELQFGKAFVERGQPHD